MKTSLFPRSRLDSDLLYTVQCWNYEIVGAHTWMYTYTCAFTCTHIHTKRFPYSVSLMPSWLVIRRLLWAPFHSPSLCYDLKPHSSRSRSQHPKVLGKSTHLQIKMEFNIEFLLNPTILNSMVPDWWFVEVPRLITLLSFQEKTNASNLCVTNNYLHSRIQFH